MSQTPDFMKTASATDISGNDETPSGAFADPINRRWPYHTKAATYNSAVELASMALGLGMRAAVDRLKTAAMVHGIRSMVDEIFDAQTRKVAAELEEHYGLTFVGEDDQPVKLFPLRHEAEIKKAAEYIVEYQDSLKLAHRRVFAQAILKRAAETGTALPSADIEANLCRQAGYGACTVADLKQAMHERALRAPEYAASLNKMAAAVTELPAPPVLAKVAVMLDGIDRETGLCRRYGADLERPEDLLFGITKQAVATAREHFVQLANGDVFAKQALRHITPAAVREWMGDGIANDVCDLSGVDLEKLAETVSILPRDDAKRFAHCARVCGVSPL